MRKLVVIGFALAAMAFVPAALADSSTVLDGYGSSAAKPVVQVKGTSGSSPSQGNSAASGNAAPTPAPSASSTLPFTGSDLAVFMVAGVVLVGIGVGLRRVGRDKA